MGWGSIRDADRKEMHLHTHTQGGRMIILGNATNKASDIKLMHPLRL